MEIIKRGTLPEEETYAARCGNCKSDIRAKGGELEHKSFQRDGDWKQAKCPVCRHLITNWTKEQNQNLLQQGNEYILCGR